MIQVENKSFDAERAFYGCDGLSLINCRFDGPADGESAMKEGKKIAAEHCYFNLRYPFWHDTSVTLKNCELTPLCRAAFWYTSDVCAENTKFHGIKALRECRDVTLRGCNISSAEFGWFSSGVKMVDTSAEGEYFMLRARDLEFKNTTLKGKYSFQYVENVTVEGCNFDTKDAFWHCKNVTIKDSFIRSEYIAWYSENLTLINCRISGTQPFCYCRGLKLINCTLEQADLAFERSEVEATLTSPVISIKNPLSGTITLPAGFETVIDIDGAKGKIITI